MRCYGAEFPAVAVAMLSVGHEIPWAKGYLGNAFLTPQLWEW